MEIFSLNDTYPIISTCVALGLFDGVHLGHLALLRTTCERAKEEGLTPAVVTFRDGSFKTRATLNTEKERLALLEKAGIERVYLLDFEEVKGLLPDTFVDTVLVEKCGARVAVCGFNYRYGKGATGSADTLLTRMMLHGGDTVIVPATVTEDGEAISSTRIRRAIEAGEVGLAKEMLSRPYAITSSVIHGQGLGHTIGIPTINQSIREGCVLPKNGVYATRVWVEGQPYLGVTNIGIRPTVGGEGVHMETHLIDFAKDIYHQEVVCEFLWYIRKESHFATLDELVAQVNKDIHEVKKYE